MAIENYRFSFQVTTGEDGTSDILIKIPGTFNGIDPAVSSGRFFSSAQLWSLSFVVNDRITEICVKDVDGVIPVPVRALFSSYPILGYSIDPDMSYDSTILGAVLLNSSRPIEIGPASVDMPRFLPSGVYISAKFVSGDSEAGRILNGNVLWTKRS